MKHNLFTIFKLIFENPRGYKELSIDEKRKWGFIVNRHMSRKYPDVAQTLNIRGGDFGLILDLWVIFLYNNKEKTSGDIISWKHWIWNKKKKT